METTPLKLSSRAETVILSDYLKCISGLFVHIRDEKASAREFKRYADRIMHLVVEEGLAYISDQSPVTITTPTKCVITGSSNNCNNIVGVSIIRAGDSMLDVFMKLIPEASIGKILIQRDEATCQPVLFYSKLPPLADKVVIILDPMLATGGSAMTAIQVLIDRGAVESNIYFFNVVSCPEGIANINSKYPGVKIVTATVDAGLNDQKYIIPGLGDYGDRYYGTQ